MGEVELSPSEASHSALDDAGILVAELTRLLNEIDGRYVARIGFIPRGHP